MAEKALCPKCKSALRYVTAVAHSQSPHMLKTTFVCYTCNRTWSYSLVAEIAARYVEEIPAA